ncbi:MAG: hypothetical protein NZ929_05340 [Aigarchaeota archaeon]|nr:hypothetical protein [Aigarchaeota archaeon]MDW7986119.1 hypothetical protein [Nitrososphaerota archaeon]
MNKIIIAMIFIMVFISSMFSLNSVYGEEVAERIIEIDRYGFVYVVDSLPVGEGVAEIGFPREYLQNLVDYYSPNAKVEMRLESEIFWLRVSSDHPSKNIKLITVFGDLLKRSGTETFMLDFSLNPLTREDLKKINLRIVLPNGSIIDKISPETIKIREDGISALGELSIDTSKVNNLKVEFKVGEISLIKPLTIYLHLDLSSNQAEYTIKLNLRDGKTLGGFDFILPNGSKLIETKDLLRKLSNSYDESLGRLHISFGGDLNVGESQTVIIKFNPPENTLYKIGEDRITIYPRLPFNLSTPDFRVSIILPSMEYTSSDPEPIEIKRVYPEKTLLTFTLGIVSPLTEDLKNFEIMVKRIPSVFSFIQYMLGASIIILIIGILTYSLRPAVKPLLKDYGEKARKLIEEVEGLIGSCRVIGDLIDSRKIFDKGYVRPRLLEVRSDVSKRISRITSISLDLKKANPEIVDIVDSLVQTSKIIERSVEDLWAQTHKYLTGSIGRKIFTTQVEDNYKTILKNSEKAVRELEALRKMIT